MALESAYVLLLVPELAPVSALVTRKSEGNGFEYGNWDGESDRGGLKN